MNKLIPTIYFYLVSLISLIILVVGIFNSIHFIVGITAYDKYPLGYTPESRCVVPALGPDQKATDVMYNQQTCLKDVEKERQAKKVDDLEKALSFTIIGALLFGIHFTYARKIKG